MRIFILTSAWALLAGLCLPVPAARAQQPAASASATGALTGTVLDSLTRQPVPYATVVLLPAAPPTETPVSGVATDERGQFSLTRLPGGSFRLRVLYVGYGTRTWPVTVGTGATALGTLHLRPTATTLAGAVVVGQKPVVEVRPDRLVYNADQDLSNAGGTAQDVLRKAPLLAVDGEGNVTMRGSGNFKVLINNKPSPTLARNLAEALKSIPAENIQSVEVITTPSARYDGEGTAGIINIVLKKGSRQAANGRVSASGGNRNYGLNAALNFRESKLNFTSSAGVGGWYLPGRATLTRTSPTPYGSDVLRQDATYLSRGHWYYGSVGLDFDPAEHHSFSLATSLNGYAGHQLNDRRSAFASPVPGVPAYQFTRDTRNVFGGLSLEATATYTRTFAQPRKEWSVLAQQAFTPDRFGYDYEQYDGALGEATPATYRERSRGRTPGRETTLQTDFTQPFGEKSKLELGAKAIFRRTGSVATIDTLGTGYGPQLRPDGRRATDFSYDQDVQAAYGIYSFGLGKKLAASVGSRLERTSLHADFRTTDSGFERGYLTWLPTANAQYTLSEASSLRVAYSRRITRPYIDYLNPFVNRATPGFVRFGNPDLAPELTDAYELSYNTSVKTLTLNASLSARHTGNAIEAVRLPTDSAGVIASTFRNVATSTIYQLNLTTSLKPTTDWTLTLTPDLYYYALNSPTLQAQRRGLSASLNLNTSYKLTKTLTLQSFAFATTPRPQLQGTGPSDFYYQAGVRKTWLNDKLDLTLTVGSPFNRSWTSRTRTRTPDFDQVSTSYPYYRTIRVTLGYRFGQEQSGRQRKSIRNDDTKTGGSKQGG